MRVPSTNNFRQERLNSPALGNARVRLQHGVALVERATGGIALKRKWVRWAILGVGGAAGRAGAGARAMGLGKTGFGEAHTAQGDEHTLRRKRRARRQPLWQREPHLRAAGKHSRARATGVHRRRGSALLRAPRRGHRAPLWRALARYTHHEPGAGRVDHHPTAHQAHAFERRKTLSRKAQEALLACSSSGRWARTTYSSATSTWSTLAAALMASRPPPTATSASTQGELTLAEGALLAGVIKSPSNYAPHLEPENAVERRDLILRKWRNAALSPQAEAEEAQKEALTLNLSEEERAIWLVSGRGGHRSAGDTRRHAR